MKYSSEILKEGIKIPEGMTDEELKKFRNSFDPDSMGFDGTETDTEE